MRGCACRGTMGLAHLSCLVRQAEVATEQWEEYDTGEGVGKWVRCYDCGQDFHGAVDVALGWAFWKTYVRRADIPQTDRGDAAATTWIFRGQVRGPAGDGRGSRFGHGNTWELAL